MSKDEKREKELVVLGVNFLYAILAKHFYSVFHFDTNLYNLFLKNFTRFFYYKHIVRPTHSLNYPLHTHSRQRKTNTHSFLEIRCFLISFYKSTRSKYQKVSS